MSELIGSCILSVKKQEFLSYEHIIVDDGSEADHLERVIKEIGDDDKVHFFKNERNIGSLSTVNSASLAAKGSLLIFLAADDILPEGSLNRTHEIYAEYPEAGVFVGDLIIRYIGSKVELISSPFRRQSKGFLTPTAARTYSLMADPFHGGVAIRRDLFLKHGQYDVNLMWHCDTIMHALLAFNYGVAYSSGPQLVFNKSSNSFGSQSNSTSAEAIRVRVRTLEAILTHAELIESGIAGKIPKVMPLVLMNKRFLPVINLRFIKIWTIFSIVRVLKRDSRIFYFICNLLRPRNAIKRNM